MGKRSPPPAGAHRPIGRADIPPVGRRARGSPDRPSPVVDRDRGDGMRGRVRWIAPALIGAAAVGRGGRDDRAGGEPPRTLNVVSVEQRCVDVDVGARAPAPATRWSVTGCCATRRPAPLRDACGGPVPTCGPSERVRLLRAWPRWTRHAQLAGALNKDERGQRVGRRRRTRRTPSRGRYACASSALRGLPPRSACSAARRRRNRRVGQTASSRGGSERSLERGPVVSAALVQLTGSLPETVEKYNESSTPRTTASVRARAHFFSSMTSCSLGHQRAERSAGRRTRALSLQLARQAQSSTRRRGSATNCPFDMLGWLGDRSLACCRQDPRSAPTLHRRWGGSRVSRLNRCGSTWSPRGPTGRPPSCSTPRRRGDDAQARDLVL